MQFDWFLSVLEQEWLENQIYYIRVAEYVTPQIHKWQTSPRMEVPLGQFLFGCKQTIRNFEKSRFDLEFLDSFCPCSFISPLKYDHKILIKSPK